MSFRFLLLWLNISCEICTPCVICRVLSQSRFQVYVSGLLHHHCRGNRNWWHTLKTESCRDTNFVVIGGTHWKPTVVWPNSSWPVTHTENRCDANFVVTGGTLKKGRFRITGPLRGKPPVWSTLTHSGRVTHICVDDLTIVDSHNGL